MRFFYDRKFRNENVTVRFGEPTRSFRNRFSCLSSVSEFSFTIYPVAFAVADIGGYLRRDLYESRREFFGVHEIVRIPRNAVDTFVICFSGTLSCG